MKCDRKTQQEPVRPRSEPEKKDERLQKKVRFVSGVEVEVKPKEVNGFSKDEKKELDEALDAALEAENLTKSSEQKDGAANPETGAASSSSVGRGSSAGNLEFP